MDITKRARNAWRRNKPFIAFIVFFLVMLLLLVGLKYIAI